MNHCKITLVDLDWWMIDTWLWFLSMNVEIATIGLNYAVRNKMVTQNLRDMSQFDETNRQIKIMNFGKKKKIKKHEHVWCFEWEKL